MLILIKGIKLIDLDFLSLMEKSMDIKKTIITEVIEVLPRIYNPETWPQKTNVPCWNCRMTFDHIPLPMIIRWNKDAIHIKGCFCDKSCFKHYVLFYKDPDINQKEIKKYISMFIDFCYKMMNIKITSIKDIEPFYKDPNYGYY
jgi:hypothetical protein